MSFGLRYSLRALGGKLGAQWERERRETLFLMAPVALSVVPHLPYLPWWTTLGFAALFVWRLGLVLSGRWLPRASVRWVAAIACTAAVFAHFHTLFGREPGVSLLVLFLGLKLMEMRARRDLFVVIFLCFFLLLTGFFQSQSIGTTVIVGIALYGLLTAMLTMQFRRQEASIGRRLRTIGLMLAQALPIALAFFVLFPRVAAPLWGLPNDAQRARTGLSDSMTPGNIAQLSESDEIAFRVLFEGDAPPIARMYWRGPVFGHFDGRVWRALPATRSTAIAPQIETDASAGPSVRYTITQEPNGRNWLFALEMLDGPITGLPEPPLLAADLQLIARRPIHERVRYTLSAHTGYFIGRNENAASLRAWTELPEGFNPRTLALAARWRSERAGEALDAERLIVRALTMFRSQGFRYTFEPPPLGRHSVDDFLFDTQAGFCEHYASAFVVLMRALGIPARVVTGYQGAERNPVDGYWSVRQADAHAWAETWLEGRGWVRVDPTGAVAPQRIERGMRLRAPAFGAITDEGPLPLFTRLRFNFDAIGNAWNQWVLSYDRARQQHLLTWIGFAADDWRELAALLAATLAVLIGAVALITLHPRTPKDPVERAYQQFCDRLAAVNLGRLQHETARRHLARVGPLLDPDRQREAQRIVDLYNRLRYDTNVPPREDVRHLRQFVHAFKP